MATDRTKFVLHEDRIPRAWYNIVADLPEPPPYRPSPLYRAHRLEKALDTPAHIYYKYEGVSPGGSHKPNTAIAQAFPTVD